MTFHRRIFPFVFLSLILIIICLGIFITGAHASDNASSSSSSATQRQKAPAKSTAKTTAGTSASVQHYLDDLRSRLFATWTPTPGTNMVVIEADVQTDGTVSQVNTGRSKADQDSVASAQEALQKIEPLGPLPSGYHGAGRLTINFHSKVDPHGDSDTRLDLNLHEITNTTMKPDNTQPKQNSSNASK